MNIPVFFLLTLTAPLSLLAFTSGTGTRHAPAEPSAASSAQPQTPAPGFRTWKDTKGREIQARALLHMGSDVILLKPDLRQYRIPLATLSEEDQEFVKTHVPKQPSATNRQVPVPQGPRPSRSDIPGPPKINRR